MPLFSARPLVLSCTAAMLALLTSAAGCRDDGTVTISGDVAGLDSIGLLADSLFARAGATALTLDSLRAVAEGRRTRTPGVATVESTVVPPRTTNAGTDAMTLRAHARGDSMARAMAMRAVGKGASERSRGDTVRGVLTLVGNDQARTVVLRTDKGATTIALSGMATTGLSKLAGADLMVRGVRTGPRDLVVTDYVVRAMNGVPTLDGRLAGGSNGWWLDMSDGTGRRRLASLPAGLQGMEGSRVWIVVGPGAAPSRSHGVIGRR